MQLLRHKMIICLACMCGLIGLVGLVAPTIAPKQAFALGSYSIDELSTELTVHPDASVRVVERQTLTFADTNAGITWYLHAPESGESVRISSVRVIPVDDGGTPLGNWTRLQMIDSRPATQGRNPGDTVDESLRMRKTQPWYSYNIGDGMLRCYFPVGKTETDNDAVAGSENETLADAQEIDEGSEETENGGAADSVADDNFRTYLIETDCTILHRIRVFRDVGELYWRYAHDSLPTDAENVSLQVVLPTSDDASADPAAIRETVRAWGHGPSGTFAISENGTVTYQVNEVAQGNYAEAHVIFPAEWLYSVAPNSAKQYSEQRTPSALAEESEWVDISRREIAWDHKVRFLFLGVALVILLCGSICAFRHGRGPLARRAMIRTAATLAIVMLGEKLFFREWLTDAMLFAFAVIALVAALIIPTKEQESGKCDSDGRELSGRDSDVSQI